MSQNKGFVLKSILTMYGMEFEPQASVEEQEVLVEVGFNRDNPVSLMSTIYAARENARSVRHIISTELWEVINQYYLFAKEYNVDFYKTRGLHDFTTHAAKHCAIVRSYLDHTLVHDDIWVFIELGISLERAAQIVRILSSKLNDIEVLTEHGVNVPLVRYQWTITLKVLEAFDMHRRVYRKPQNQYSVLEFLCTHTRFPRSVAYNLRRVEQLIAQLGQQTRSGRTLAFKAGKLSSYFQYLEYEEIKEDLPAFLAEANQRIFRLNELIEETYFQA